MTATLTDRTYAVAWDWGDYADDLVMHGKLQLRDDGTLQRWNGFVCPFFTRDEIDRYTAHVEASDPDNMYGRVSWDGDTLLLTEPTYADPPKPGENGIDYDPDYQPERIDPTPDGLYALGAFGWTWSVCPPDVDPEDILDADEAEAIGRDPGLRDSGGIQHIGMNLTADETTKLIAYRRSLYDSPR